MTAITTTGVGAARRGITGIATAVEAIDRALSTRRRRVVMAVVVVVTTAVSLWLRARGYPWLIADMVYDDAYFARSAGHLLEGNWLGPHDMVTLSKGPTYPLFIAGAYQLHVPLKLAEHALHLLAGATLAWAAWRVTRVRLIAVAAYVLVALNPAYLGSAASRVSREVVYGALSLILVCGLIIFLTYVPALVARGPRWSVPGGLAAGLAIGVTLAAYYLCREERSWLAPALAVAVLAGVARWGRIGRAWIPKALLTGGALVVAAMVLAGSLQWVSSRNEEEYGAAVITDLVEGPIADAYAQWQRVDVGEARRFVVVTEDQRRAVYAVSPAAAELRRTLEWQRGPEMWGAGCLLADICDDYTGAQFIWALRLSAAISGNMDSADEAYAFFGRIGDDIEAACGVEFECTAPGIASMPPVERAALRPLPTSMLDSAWFLARFDVADPNRVLTGFGPSPYTPSGGTPEQWATMTAPLRGVVDDQRTYRAEERDAMKDQELVRVLWFVYRWGALAGAVLATVGLVAVVVTGAWRRHLALGLTAATFLVAVLTRIAVFALVDATAYPTAGNGTYVLPGVDFYLAFGLLGTWLLAIVARDVGSQAQVTEGSTVEQAAPRAATVPETPASSHTVLVP